MIHARRKPVLDALTVLLITLSVSGCLRTEVLGEDLTGGGGMGAGTGAGTSMQPGDGDGMYPGSMEPGSMEPGSMEPGSMEPGDSMRPDTCGATQVAVGIDSTCAVTESGALYCWGRDVVTDQRITTPRRVTSIMGKVASVTLGAAHVCALTVHGTVWCWGQNWAGQVGDGTTATATHPTPLIDVTDSVQIDAGFAHTCAVRSNGEAWCWGNNDNGQLGAGEPSLPSPTMVWSRIERAEKVSAGFGHTCILDSNARVHCIGSNTHGQLGNGTDQPSTDFLSLDLAATDVSAGNDHTCAVDDQHRVWCWGANASGQLGDGTTGGAIGAGMPSGRTSPVRVLNIGGIGSVHAALDHTCAVHLMGLVYCWGANQFGALGNSELDEPGDHQLEPVHASLLGSGSVDQLTVGPSHNCAIHADGSLACWGSNSFGAIGDSTLDDRYQPVAITGFDCD